MFVMLKGVQEAIYLVSMAPTGAILSARYTADSRSISTQTLYLSRGQFLLAQFDLKEWEWSW